MAEDTTAATKHIGRPTLLTPALQETICKYIAKGSYVSVAFKAAGISEQCLRLWKVRAGTGEEPYLTLFEALKTAEAEAEVALVTLVREHAEGPQQWAAGMTLLERRHPQRWGRHDRVDHELSQQGMELLQRLREIGERPAVEGPVVEGEARELSPAPPPTQEEE